MYEIVLDLFKEFGLDRMPETFPELVPWLIAVFIGAGTVVYLLDMVFILVKAVAGRGRKT